MNVLGFNYANAIGHEREFWSLCHAHSLLFYLTQLFDSINMQYLFQQMYLNFLSFLNIGIAQMIGIFHHRR